jgi:hypothetical protein
MRFRPNEIYGRVIEIGADAPRAVTLERFLSSFRAHVAAAPAESLPVSRFLDFLSAAAGSSHDEVRAPADEASGPPDWRRVLGLLDRQIADLRAMAAGGQLEDERRYLGLDAPSGRRWFSFDVHSFFECAATASFHSLDPDGEEMEFLSWSDVESFLLYGQMYE